MLGDPRSLRARAQGLISATLDTARQCSKMSAVVTSAAAVPTRARARIVCERRRASPSSLGGGKNRTQIVVCSERRSNGIQLHLSVVPRCAGAPTRSDRSTRRRRPSRDWYRWTESATTSCANHPRRSRARSGRSPPTSAPFERTSAPSPRSGWTSSTTTANESSRAGTASVTTLTSEITCRTPRRR